MKVDMSTESIQEQLGELTIFVQDDDILIKMQELCFVYHKSAEDIVSAWAAFFTTKQLDRVPTLDALSRFEREELSKQKKKSTPPNPHYNHSSSASHSPPTNSKNADLLCQYASPDIRKRIKTPESGSSKRYMSGNGTPVATLTPKAHSSATTTPSVKYASRSSRRSVVRSFGKEITSWKGNEGSCQIDLYDKETALPKKYTYMFEKLRNRSGVLNSMIVELGDLLMDRHSIEEWSSLQLMSPDEITILGRIFCDGNGKLNASSVWIEGSQEISAGKCLQLDLSEIKEWSLFPGQIVALRGIQNQNKVIVKSMFDGALPPSAVSALAITPIDTLQIVVAVGPFTTSETLSYEPLNDLLEYVCEHTPHILLLIGPFIDVKHELITKGVIAETYSEMFERNISEICCKLESLNTQVVLVPSLRDVHQDEIYPTPPFVLKQKIQKLHCFPEPCMLNVNGLTIGISSTDILFHLGKEEMSSGTSDRMSRLCHHILTQHNFYPLYPPSEEVNICYEHFEVHAQLTVTPHLMILPSDLRSFIKEVEGCCFVNPERLTKGCVGGTFARIAVSAPSPSADDNRKNVPEITAEILKI